MANFYGTARSNYFRVKDAEEFKARMSDLPHVRVWEGQNEERSGMFAICSEDPDSGCWPSSQLDEETQDYVEIDIFDLVAEHLADDEVAVFMEAGAEKLRYISGYAVAVNCKGDQVCVSLSDIYAKAKEAFGITPTDASY